MNANIRSMNAYVPARTSTTKLSQIDARSPFFAFGITCFSADVVMLSLLFIQMLTILISSCYGATNSSSQDSSVKCSIRYDLVAGSARRLCDSFSCQWWYSQSPLCDYDFRVMYYNNPPYMVTLPDGSADGILPALLNISLKACCGKCTRISYIPPFNSIEESTKWFFNASFYSIMMPALTVSNAEVYFRNPFVQVMNSPGVIYVTIDKSAEEFLNKTFQSISGTWPLAIITILLTVQGGILIWLFEQRKNPDEFPGSFIRGALEGSWWAYISMTTVGYGDKAPRSIPGRLFAFFWIVVGITITSIFTASLSSSLTSAAIPGKTSLEALKVGYLRQVAMAYEANIIYKEGGIPKHFEKFGKMIEALRTTQIDGILIDALAFRYYKDEFEGSGLKLAHKTDIENSQTAIGLMFSSPALQNWATFLNSFFKGNKDAESRLLREAADQMKTKFSMSNAAIKTSQMSEQGNAYGYIMVAVAASGGIIFCVGVLFQLLKKFHFSHLIQRVNSSHEMEVQKDDEYEDRPKKGSWVT